MCEALVRGMLTVLPWQCKCLNAHRLDRVLFILIFPLLIAAKSRGFKPTEFVVDGGFVASVAHFVLANLFQTTWIGRDNPNFAIAMLVFGMTSFLAVAVHTRLRLVSSPRMNHAEGLGVTA